MTNELKLGRVWKVSDQIGSGGFGRVFAAISDTDEDAVVKLVPKAPGAQREMLFTGLNDVRNIVPIIDSGETEDAWVLVMPRAECSLRDHIDQTTGGLGLPEVVSVLIDIATALTDLDGKVVHRDLKPENILRLNGIWCLADFGISRYAEATTSPDTQKHAISPPYTSPERWRSETASIAADIYSLGVVAYELLAGNRPFPGPSASDFRQQHLHTSPPAVETNPALAALVEECMYKAPEARPRPGNVVARLANLASVAPSGGLAVLQEANKSQARQIGEASRQASEAQSEAERRSLLHGAASAARQRITHATRDAVEQAASTATFSSPIEGGWSARLGEATLHMSGAERTAAHPWGKWPGPSFEVVAHATIGIRFPMDRHQYEGRVHSLWFCDAQDAGNFQWYETAFMVSPLMPRRARQDPFALSPCEDAAKALSNAITEFQVAWPFTSLTVGQLDDFISQWANWLGMAAQRQLTHPSSMPEREVRGSWR